ncbi:MAG: nitrous oxide reductase accessory protein NosL [Deltaproteobacteria bacterium]
MKKLGLYMFTIAGIIALLGFAGGAATAQTVNTTCPNCGMVLKEWAHTNHEFTNPEGSFRTCSIHCVADMSLKSGTQPKDVRVALHLQPEKMIPASTAVYVIGSKDPGTMTQVSKLAFESKEAAEKFMGEKGGKAGAFADALAAATEELPKAKPMIQTNRKNKGKIVDPTDQDRCPVCNMIPARYPEFNVQLLTADKKRLHFCSTQCLFLFMQEPGKHGASVGGVGDVWLHDYVSGRYIFAKNAYYVVGSKVHGPMGPEAIAFDLKSEASEFTKTNNGQVLKFEELTPACIKAK